MDHFETRSWRGIHRHLYISQLSLLFCGRVHHRLREKNAGDFVSDSGAGSPSRLRLGGHVLKYSYTNDVKKAKVYRGGSACRQCRHFGKCTNQPRGRGISRLLKAELQQKLETQYEEPESQKTYGLRKQKVELPFGHIKRNLKVDSFLLRGLAGVKAEASLFASCFNIARMITLVGVAGLISELGD